MTMGFSSGQRRCIAAFVTVLGLGACKADAPTSDADAGSPDTPACRSPNGCVPPDEKPTQQDPPVTLSLSASTQAALTQLDSDLQPLRAATTDSLLQAHPLSFQNDLGYDPKAAVNLDMIQASPLGLSAAELDKLGEQGFAISTRMAFPNMANGLRSIYAQDLPVYISIDPILDAVHNAYDAILEGVELGVLIHDLDKLLDSARTRNAAQTSDADARKDLDFYFTVALGMLRGETVAPLAGADAKLIASFVSKADAASGIEKVSLFGVPRQVDFSQFTPRGHYADETALKQYFRAMMWLGRIDFRLIETQPDGSQVFHRRQLNAMLALRDAVSGATAEFERIDAVLTAFVGEHDYMQLAEIAPLLADLGASSIADVAKLSDQQVAQTIIDKAYGAQRILSQVIFKDDSTFAATLPLDRSFAFLGQRYVVDSQVFSDVTYDRVLPTATTAPRLLPDPLDAAYAALGNSAALPLLRGDLNAHGYAPQLERIRKLVDPRDAAFWDQNLYNTWLSALRALSPTEAMDDVPTVARTERWSRRVLNTQLGSWAQLRHDTILYAKQSYTGGNSCEYPDAYVDPYPEAFARLVVFAQKGSALASLLGQSESSELVQRITTYFAELASVSNILRDMAEQQKKGVAFNAAQMAFVNDAVKSRVLGCGGPASYTGWYAKLMFKRDDGDMDPTIADVHTDPGGDRPPHVLHVATGLPRLMVLTVNTCQGPRAYAGVTFAYHEVVADGLKRFTDAEWATMAAKAADVPWLEPVLR